jgi:hypothetical protein
LTCQPLRRRVTGHRKPQRCRRSYLRTTNAKSCWNPTVGTTKGSIAAIPSIWLRTKVFQFCDGRSGRGTM